MKFKLDIKEGMKLDFPKVPTYKMVQGYMMSKKELTKYQRSYEFDKARQGPVALLETSRRTLIRSEERLDRKREDSKTKRETLDAQWKDLEEKEKSLQENFVIFNNFVKKNAEKRARAQGRLDQAMEFYNENTREYNRIIGLKGDMEGYKRNMDIEIRKYHLYEGYLNEVVTASTEFKTITDLVNRYESLVDAKKTLAVRQERDLTLLENARNQVVHQLNGYTLEILGLNNDLASLNSRYQKATAKCRKWETLVTNIKQRTFETFNNINQVRQGLRTIYLMMCHRKGVEPKVSEFDYEGQLLFIKETMEELKWVNNAATTTMKKNITSTAVETSKGTKR